MAKRHSMLVSAACLVALALFLPVALTGCVGQANIGLAEAALRGDARQAAVPVEPIVVQLQAEGQLRRVATFAETVAEVLAEVEIELGEHDRVEPPAEAGLSGLELIRVIRRQVVEETTLHRVYFHEVRRPNTSMELGVTKVLQQGKEGQRAEHYRVVLEDGVEVERTLIGAEVMIENVDRIVDYGTIGTIDRDGVE